MKKKYIVVGGWIESEKDEDIHFISAQKLCVLYNVNPNECYLLHEKKMFQLPEQLMRSLPNLPILRPQYRGIEYKKKQ